MDSTDILIFGLCGMGAGYLIHMLLSVVLRNSSVHEVQRIMRQAERDADNIRRDAEMQARDDVLKAREKFEATLALRRSELNNLDTRLTHREEQLAHRMDALEIKERTFETRDAELSRHTQEVAQARADVELQKQAAAARLQELAGMTGEAARAELYARAETEVGGEMAGLVRRLQETAQATAERTAQTIVAQAVQHYTAGHPGSLMTSTVTLPNEEMKGRIIGRDGRNIRAIETATGVSVLVDDTPEMIVISAFDPLRREIARVALNQLIEDGRINPSRIEEVVEKARVEVEQGMRAVGEAAMLDVGVQNLDPELVLLLGRLTFRTSYAQNVLTHSIEAAKLMGNMASEMNLDPVLARRIGLLHDIGKAVDREVEGSHAQIGADLLRRYGEIPLVVNAVAAHHEEVPVESAYGWLVMACDALSAARPGARSVTTDMYMKRLEKLETMAAGFPGVERVFAIQAGREVRVLVQPEAVSDAEALVLARSICRKIESELRYPGTIRVTVVRETRAVEYAR